jgi:hypothetical protein
MAYRLREFPKMFANGAYPPNTLLMIDRLVQEQFLVECRRSRRCNGGQALIAVFLSSGAGVLNGPFRRRVSP